MKVPHILIVDDDPSIRKVVSVNLSARNYIVSTAADGDAALSLLEKETPDAIILDILLPALDGFEVCRRLRQHSAVPIIMFSAREKEGDQERCFACGANGYLTKPFSLNELLSLLKAVLAAHPAGGPG
jgi:DNA-binding response OmpR family regulator